MSKDLQVKKISIIEKLASQYSVDPRKMMATLKATAFRQKDNAEITNEQLMALCIVADQYHLNPWTKEIYAFPSKNGIVPIVGIDGWARIINENPQFNGMEFNQSENIVEPAGGKSCPEWIECSIHRKDREHPTVVREYIDEVYREPITPKGKNYTITSPWQTHTKRFLRHKAMIQCSRIAFAFVGIHDQDEAERIIEAEAIREPEYKAPRITQDQKDEFYLQMVKALDDADDVTVNELYNEWSNDEILVLNGLFNPSQRQAIKAIRATKKGEDNG